MGEFAYKAKRSDGKIVTGKISSANKIAAKNAILNRGLKPLKVVPVLTPKNGDKSLNTGYIYRDRKGNIAIRLSKDLPTDKELAVFTKQLSLMIENGVSILQALNLLESQQKRVTFANIIKAVTEAVEKKGAQLSDAIALHPNVFDDLYVAMVKAGEASGRLDLILRQLVTYIEKSIKIKAQVKSAMAYPVIVVVVATAVITLLLAFVVPSFAKQFKDSGQQLPGLTEFVVNLSEGFLGNLPFILGFGVLAFFVFRLWLKSEKGRQAFDTYILKSPVLGDVLLKIAIGRFCSTMSTMLSSGVAILEALSICAASAGNKRIEKMVFDVRGAITQGQNFSMPLEKTGVFPRMVTSMVAVGEQTGTLDATLAKITEIYEEEVDVAIKAMTSMIEPLMIVVIGSIVGFIVIAMYLPIFDIAGTIGG